MNMMAKIDVVDTRCERGKVIDSARTSTVEV
jgi:hypothetical protein